MKIRVMAAVIVMSALFHTVVSAENTLTVEPVNLVSDMVTIKGHVDSENELVTVIVANPGVEPENITSGTDLLQQYWETETDDNGNYSFSFEMSEVAVSGEYSVFIMSSELSKTMKSTFYFATTEDRKTAIEEINEKSIDYIAGKIDEYAKVLGADDFDALNGADDKEIAKHLKKYIPYEEDGYVEVQKKLMEGAILSCYRNKNTEYIYNEKGEAKNASIIGFDTLDNDYDCTLYMVFNNILNGTGKKAVFSNISKDYADFDALKKDFMTNVFLLAIDNTDKMGGGHISDIITSKNTEAVGMDADKYLDYSNKNALNNKIVEKGSFSSLKELEETIADIIKNLEKNNNSSGGNSGGTGGAGSMAGAAASILPQVQEKEEELVFSDVDRTFWGKEAIVYLYKNGIVNGFDDGTFKPNEYIKREQAVKMFMAAFDIEEAEYDGSFSDVNKSDWFSGFVSGAVKKEFVKGISGSLFGVGKNITREDFAVMLYRIIGENTAGKSDFSDYDEISEYAKDAVSYMNENGYINGYSDATFRPKKEITRAEAASIIYRYIKR